MSSTSLVVVTRDEAGNITKFVDESGKTLPLANIIADIGSPKGTVLPGAPEVFRVNEGSVLSIEASVTGAGKYEQVDIKTGQTIGAVVSIGNKAKLTTAAKKGTVYYLITTTAGSIDAMVEDAVLGGLQVVGQVGGSQSVRTPDDVLRFAGVSLRRDVAVCQQFVGNLGASTYTAQSRTWLSKMSAPCEFDAIQLVIGHAGPTTPTIKAIVAVTETAANDTPANRFNPIVGGVAYMTVDSTNEQYGFKTPRWGGAGTKTYAGTGTRYNMEYAISDILPLSSVPRADIPGANPLLIVRVFNDGTSQPLVCYVDAGLANLRTAGGANGNQIFQCAYDSGLDEVATPGSNPGSLSTATIVVGAIFYSRRSGASYVTIGDSITENDGLVADKLSSWGLRAADAVSTQSAPVAYVNAGCSGQNSTAYLASGLSALAALKPNVAQYSAWSPNDFSGVPTVAVLRNRIEKMASNLQVFLDYCAKNRIISIVSTGIPNPASLTTPALDNMRKAYNDSIRTRAASGQFILCDMDAAVSDNASPANILPAYNWLGDGGGIHPNEAGIAVMGGVAAAALKKALY